MYVLQYIGSPHPPWATDRLLECLSKSLDFTVSNQHLLYSLNAQAGRNKLRGHMGASHDGKPRSTRKGSSAGAKKSEFSGLKMRATAERTSFGQPNWLVDGGEIGDLIRSMDWTATPLGPLHTWPQSLRTVVNLVLASRFPMCVLWGDDLIMLYNEGYRIIAAGKHPQALGRSSREIWPEVWEFNKPIFEKVMAQGEAVLFEDQVFAITRNGYLEQASFTICYSPIYQEAGGIGGTLVTLVETTQRIKAEGSLRTTLHQTDQRLQALLEAVPVGISYSDDPTCRQITGNPAVLAQFEVGPGDNLSASASDTAAPGRQVRFFRDGGVIKDSDLPLQRAVAENRTIAPMELEVHLPSGRHWTAEASGAPVRDRDGNVLGGIAVTVDITARKRAEAQLSQSQKTFTELVERAPFGIYIVDSQFRIAQMNAGSQNGAFRNVRPVIGRDFSEAMRILWPEPVATEIIAEFRHTLDTGEPYYSPRFFNPRQDVEAVEGYEWELHRMTLPDGQYGVVCYYFDSTKLRQAEAAVRISEKKYRQLFDTMIEGFLLVEPILDESGKPVSFRYLDANPALANLTPLQPENIIGRDVREILPNIEPHWVEAFARVAMTGRPERIEQFSRDLNGWYDVQIYCPEAGKAALIYTNTTERRMAEAERERLLGAVQEERDRLAALIDSIPDEVWFADSDGKFTLANPSALNEFTLHESDGAVGIQELASRLEVYRPDGSVRPVEEAPPLRALNGETVRNQEEIIRTPSTGELRYRQVNANAVRDYRGRIIGSVSVVRDITERKRTEATLEKMQSILSEGQRIAHVGTFEYVAETRTTAWSDEECRIYGLAPGTPSPPYDVMLEKFIHPEDASLLHETFTAAMQSRSIYELEHRILRPDGTVRVVYDQAHPHFDGHGNLVRYVGATLDITERKQAEVALQENRRQLEILMQNLQTGVALIDEQGKFSIVNPAFMRMFDIEAEADIKNINDRNWADWQVFHENGELLDVDEHPARKAALTGKPVRDKLVGVRSPSSRDLKWMLVSAEPIDKPDDHRGPVICTYYDITERRRAEQMVQAANEELKRADRRKDEFLAMLAHELRNPLAAISSANELLRLRGSTEPMIRRAREAAARQTAHMARLLDDLLDVSRVTQGKVTLNKEDAPVLSFLESAIEASNPFMNARNHQLYVSHPREPMRVHGDRVRLSQAVGNLLHNAAKYTAPGGKIYLVAQRDGDQVLISVQDNGNGIDSELLPHVFELFVQGSRSPDRAEGGLGVGLTLTKSIIELHNGRVEASSEGPGRGSEFRIWLPLVPIPEKQIGAMESATAEKVRSLRILVVDDNVDAAELLSALLGIEGHEVSVANSGPAAIDLALKDPPDVALLDIGMPGMDGFEVARRMRDSELLKSMKLIAVSGYGQHEDMQKSREAGFDHHLVKPVDVETLGKVLRKITIIS